MTRDDLAALVREMFAAEAASKTADAALVDANDRADSLYGTSLRFPDDMVIADLRAKNLSDCGVLTGVRSEARRRLSDARETLKAAVSAPPADPQAMHRADETPDCTCNHPDTGMHTDECAWVQSHQQADPQAMPAIRVGDVLALAMWDGTSDYHETVTAKNLAYILRVAGETDDVNAIYRDPLWRRPQAMPTEGQP